MHRFAVELGKKRRQRGRQREGKRLGGGGGVPLTVGDEFDRGHLQTRGSSARDRHVLEASRAKGQKGEDRGVPGLLIGGLCLEEKLGFAPIRSTAGKESVREEEFV
jgi:hypothetical protein